MPRETQKGNSGRRYAVFLSYRHSDNKEQGRQWATWLHQVLEGYEIPTDLVGSENSKGDPIPASLYPVFRDEEELPADADLTRNIRHALENTELLVVLCSPRAVESRFVADEIRYFKELGKADRILALMIDGEPNASDDPGKAKLGIKPEAECLPEPLRYGVAGNNGKIDWTQRTEPIAADTRPAGMPEQGWTTGAAYREALQKIGDSNEKEIAQKVRDYEQRLELAKLKVVSGALGVPLGVLTKRDKAMQLKRARHRARVLKLWLAAVGVLAILAVAGGIYARLQRQEAIAQRKVAEAQRKEALKTASATDFAIADLKHQGGDIPAALAYLSQSLQNNRQNLGAASLLVSLCRNQPYPVRILSHPGNVYAASFSPDGKWLVTASWDHTAQVWDVMTGKPVGQPMRHDDIIFGASFSPNGKWIVTASNDKTARLWDARTGTALGKPMRHDGCVWSASFSPDSKRIVTASSDKTARIWDVQTSEPVGQPMRHKFVVWTANFSPDGNWIVTASADGAQIWDARTNKAVGAPFHNDEDVGGALAASFSPDGRRIVTASVNKTAQVWDVQTRKLVGEPMRHNDSVWRASFSPDGRRIVTASFDNTARIWDAQTGDAMGQPMRHNARVYSASFSPDGRWIATASMDHTARIWDAQTLKTVGESFCSDQYSLETTAVFSPNGKWIATTSGDKILRVWNAMTGRLVGEPVRHKEDISAASFSPDGKWIVTASGKQARIWDARTGKPEGKPMQHESRVLVASFGADGRRIVTASGNEARIWDVQTGKPIGEPMRHDHILSASFSRDGKRIVTSSRKEVRVWDAQTCKAFGEPIHDDDIIAISISPDGKSIVTGLGNSARIWDARTGKTVGKPLRHDLAVVSVNFSPDGKKVVTASVDKTARVWDAQTGKPLTEPMQHKESLASASFSPDGKWVVTAATYEGTVRVWSAQTGREVNELTGLWDTVVTSTSFSPDGRWILASMAGKARVWESGCVMNEAPQWLMTLAEAVGGRRLNGNGVLEPFHSDSNQLREKLRNLSGNDDLSRFGRWFVANPYTRTISPLSSVTVPEFVSQRLQENSAQSVDEAYRIDPGNPLIIASLAKFEKDKDRALFLCRYALKLAKVEGGDPFAEKVHSIVLTVFPDFAE
jgi:WD40 repeat protein